MARLDSEIKRVVAKAEKTAEATRQSPSTDRRLEAREREIGELLAGALGATGLDTARLDALRDRHSTELERVLESNRKAALKGSRGKLRELTDNLESRIDGMGHLGALPPGNYTTITLRKPVLIWAGKHSSAILMDSHTADDDSWAKVHINLTRDDEEGPEIQRGVRRLSFWYMWQNETDNFAVISVHTYMALFGFIKMVAKGSNWNVFLGGPDFTVRFVHAHLAWWKWWDPYKSGGIEIAKEQISFISLSNGVYDKSHTERLNTVQRIESASDVITMPPRSTVVLEAAITFPVGIEDEYGTVDFDFASGDYRIACPWMYVKVLTPIP